MREILMIVTALGFLSLTIPPVARAQEASIPPGRIALKLVGGDTISGTPGPVKDGSVSMVTDYGVVRVPIEKLSDESKAKLGVTAVVDSAALKKRITELEALVERLREENATLRKASQPAITPSPSPSPTPRQGISPDPQPATGGTYRLTSTGKRHNSRCRYFSSAGRACSATEGVACKICGG